MWGNYWSYDGRSGNNHYLVILYAWVLFIGRLEILDRSEWDNDWSYIKRY